MCVKSTLPYVLAVLSLTGVTSCSHDDTSATPESLSKTTYSGSSLQLYYNGDPMPSKSITVTQSGNNAEIEAFSDFNIAQLGIEGLTGDMPAPGIVPGTPRLNLTTVLKPEKGGWIFNGESSNAACTFSYEGYATPDELKLYINDAKLFALLSPSVWQPAAQSPLVLRWDYDPLPGVDFDFTYLLKAISEMPIVSYPGSTEKTSLAQALSRLVRTIAFLHDGNIIVTYVSTVNGYPSVSQTMPNRFQYAVAAPGVIKVYPDPMSVLGLLLMNTSTPTPGADVELTDTGLYPTREIKPSVTLSPMVKNILKEVTPMLFPALAEGLPFDYATTDAGIEITLDNQLALGMASKALNVILNDDQTLQTIVKVLSENPATAPMLFKLEDALQALPKVLERTDTLQIGILLEPYK